MSDGHGFEPSTPHQGWARDRPPPYTGGGQTPWASPGEAPADRPEPGQRPTGQGPGGHDGPRQWPGAAQGAPSYAPPSGPYGPAGGAWPHGPGGHSPNGWQGYGQGGHGAHGPPGHLGPYGFRPPPAAPRPGVIPLRPLGLGDILDGTIKLIRSNPKVMLGLSAIAAAIGTLPLAIAQAMYSRSIGDMLDDPAGREVSMEELLAQAGGGLLSYIMQFLLVTILTGLFTRILGRAVFGGRITGGEAWRLTRSRLPALLGLALLSGLIVAVPLVACVAAVAALAGAGADLKITVVVAVVLGLCYLAFAITLHTRLSLAAAAVVLERRGAIDAMHRSWTLVTGGFWRTLGILILTQILAGLLGGILSLPFSVAGMIVSYGGRGSMAAAVIITVLATIGGILSSMITYPFQAGVNGLLYTDRRMRAEAFDLALQTAAAEQQRQGWVSSAADELWHPSHAAGATGPARLPGAFGAP